jgi:hypothetical protein
MKRAIAVLLVFIVSLSFVSLLQPAEAQTWTYTVTGPYWEDGTVAAANVSLVWSYPNGAIYRSWLNSSGVTPDSDVINSNQAVEQVLWIEDGETDTQRYIDFDPEDTSQSFKIVIPSSLFASYYYYVQVSDFAGVSSAYLQSKRVIAGVPSVVEQRSLNWTGDHTLLLAQWATYTLSVVCEEGTYSESYMAGDPTVVHSIILPSGLFSEDFEAGAEVTAERYNSTEIIVSQGYPEAADYSNLTIWHLDEYSLSNWQIVDYQEDYGAGNFTLYWNNGVEGQDYFVDVTVAIGSVLYVWNFSCPDQRSYESIDDLIFAVGSFGDFGVDPAGLIAFAICLILAGCFSYANSAMGMAVTLLGAVVLSIIGVYEFALANLGLGAFFVWLCHILEGKKYEREW